MIKAILFDIDGVLIRHEKYFSESLSPVIYNNPALILNTLYKSDDNKRCDKGDLDILIYIKPFLDKINWDKSIKEYLNMQYEFESQYIDFELLNKIEMIKNKGIFTIIASNQNPIRKKYLMDIMNVENIFNDSYFSCDIGFVKSENEYWINVIKKIRVKFNEIKNEEILFLDDLSENTKKAIEFGINANVINCKEDINNALILINN